MILALPKRGTDDVPEKIIGGAMPGAGAAPVAFARRQMRGWLQCGGLLFRPTEGLRNSRHTPPASTKLQSFPARIRIVFPEY